MRSGWTMGVALVLLPACTRPNPAFGDTEGDPTAGVATTSTFTSAGGSAESSTPVSTAGDSLGTSGPDSGPATQDGSSAEDPMESGPGCMLLFHDGYGIESMPPLDQVFPGCPEIGTVTMVGSTQDGGTRFDGDRCPSCNCSDEFPISLTFSLPLPELSGCYDLIAQLDAGTCKVRAYELVPAGEGLPRVIASNVAVPVLPLPMTVELGESPSAACNEGCVPPSGHYPLVFDGATQAPPNGMPVQLEPYTYSVVNDDAGIDIDCHDVGRWHAELMDPM